VPAYTVNQDAVRHAKRLIDGRQYVLRSRWQDVQPRAREQNAFLKTHSWEEYAAWHLGLTEGADEEAKARYAFVYGDFRRLHRMGLIACHSVPRSGGTRRSSWQHTSSCSTSTERPPDDAAARVVAPLTESLERKNRRNRLVRSEQRLRLDKGRGRRERVAVEAR
jgi:hypothetical protein